MQNSWTSTFRFHQTRVERNRHTRRPEYVTDKLSVALVGCGRVAERYGVLLSAGDVAGMELVAACDTDTKKAADFGSTWGVKSFTDYHEMMKDARPDVVAILTESGNHAKHTADIASYGAHIVVEKPMALTPRDADEMIRACDQANVRLFVVKQNRLNGPVVKLRDALDGGRFGKLVMGSIRLLWSRDQSYYDQDDWRGTWALDGGVFANQAIHHLDLLLWMLGTPISVYAVARTALVDIETEDTGAAIIEFENGAIGTIDVTTAVRPINLEASLTLIGAGGTAKIGGTSVNEMLAWRFTDGLDDEETVLQEYQELPPDAYGFGHRAYLEQVVEAINTMGPALVDGLEGRRSLEVLGALYESIETGVPVRLTYEPKHARLGRPDKNDL
jgi:UDP-N-acetyl-2-amino-2-deoxyglucuronate dehydrogenase